MNGRQEGREGRYGVLALELQRSEGGSNGLQTGSPGSGAAAWGEDPRLTDLRHHHQVLAGPGPPQEGPCVAASVITPSCPAPPPPSLGPAPSTSKTVKTAVQPWQGLKACLSPRRVFTTVKHVTSLRKCAPHNNNNNKQGQL